MFEEKEIKLPVASINTTSGLVSYLQLVDTTSSEMFATTRKDTSEIETRCIIYPSVELPKEEKCLHRPQLSAR